MMKARFSAIQVALKKLAARRPPRARPINNLHNFLEKRGEVWPNAALEKLLKKHDVLKVKMFEFSCQIVENWNKYFAHFLKGISILCPNESFLTVRFFLSFFS